MVTPEDIADVVSKWTKIPVKKLAEEENGEYTFDEDRVRAGTNFADLTLGYNKADQKIGTHVRYLLLILDAFH